MLPTEIEAFVRNLPGFQQAIEQKTKDEIARATADRTAIIDEIAAIEAKREKADEELARASRAADAIREKLDAAVREARAAEHESSRLWARYNHLNRVLLKQHGEKYALDAQTKLNARLRHLEGEEVRLEGLAHRIVETVPGLRRIEKSPQHVEQLAAIRSELELVQDALKRVGLLVNARMAPEEVRRQAEIIMATVDD